MKLDGKVIQAAILQVIEDYKFDANQIVDIVKMGIKSAFKRDYEQYRRANIMVDIEDSGDIKFYRIFTVVPEVEDEQNEISVDEAQKQAEGIEVGEELYVDITPDNLEFTRIGVQSAAQTIKQHIKEIEKHRFFDKFSQKEWELLKGKVTKVNGTTIVIDVDGVPVVLPPQWQIPQKDYAVGDDIFVFLRSINKWQWGAQLDVTQSSPDFVEAILKKIIPELSEGLIEIEKIVRIPGKKTKVVVRSLHEHLDPIGVMLGQWGERINILLSLLDGEKVDFIEYEDDIEEYIRKVLQPAKIDRVDIGKNVAKVYCAENQKSLAIGKGAANIKLAMQLTGYRIDILSS